MVDDTTRVRTALGLGPDLADIETRLQNVERALGFRPSDGPKCLHCGRQTTLWSGEPTICICRINPPETWGIGESDADS